MKCENYAELFVIKDGEKYIKEIIVPNRDVLKLNITGADGFRYFDVIEGTDKKINFSPYYYFGTRMFIDIEKGLLINKEEKLSIEFVDNNKFKTLLKSISESNDFFIDICYTDQGNFYVMLNCDKTVGEIRSLRSEKKGKVLKRDCKNFANI